MNRLLGWYRWVNILSLDVAAGAVISALFFVQIANAQVYPLSLFALGLSVWIIYTIDHLKDVYRLNRVATTNRHRFHQENFKPLLVITSVSLSLILALAFYLRPGILSWGFGLAILVCLYLVVSHYLLFVKEIAATILYSAGVFLPALSQSSSVTVLIFRWESLLFIILVMVNLLLFSVYEMEEDSRSQHYSFALYFGRKMTMAIIQSLLLIAGCTLVYHWRTAPLDHLTVLGLMTLTLAVIVALPSYFATHERYRYLGDLIFLFPALALLS